MKHSTCICQTILIDMELNIAELTRKLEEERAYSKMLEADMESKISSRADVIAAQEVQDRIEATGLSGVVKTLEQHVAAGMKVVEVRV